MRFWRRVSWTLVGLATLEVASRTVLPGINPGRLAQLPHDGILGLYQWLGGGGFMRGAVLGLGLMPYLAARVWVWLSRLRNPAARTTEGRRRMQRDTRALTVLLSVIQAYGFTRFIVGIPGVVFEPSTPWILQTIAILTLSSVAAMMVAEMISPQTAPDDDEAEQLLLSSPATEFRASEVARADVPSAVER